MGRVISGYISDFPKVDSLFVTNVCILVSGLAVFCVPFCNSYVGFCIAATFFGLFSCISFTPSIYILFFLILFYPFHIAAAFIALTSIVLVDLLGIHQLTNAFGLLCLLRGVAAIAGPPLAGNNKVYYIRLLSP